MKLPPSASVEASSPEVILRSYFHAKDENRPHLLAGVFCEDATLEVVNRSSAIAFPAVSAGREAIADVLVRNFGQTYENVYSFYMQRPVAPAPGFSCKWLVAMSEKASRAVRVGCGRYDWSFAEEPPHLADHLVITIEAMQVLLPDALPAVLDWLGRLSYPWSSAAAVTAGAPTIASLAPVLKYLGGNDGAV